MPLYWSPTAGWTVLVYGRDDVGSGELAHRDTEKDVTTTHHDNRPTTYGRRSLPSPRSTTR